MQPSGWGSDANRGAQDVTNLILTLLLEGVIYLIFVLFGSLLWFRLRLVGDRVDALDILRGICASLVLGAHAVKTHSVYATGTPYNFDPASYWAILGGDLGVVTFFLITGYLFFGVAYPRQSEGLSTARDFLLRRFRRLGPAFFALATVSFLFHVAYLWFQDDPRDLPYYLVAWARLNSFGAAFKPLLADNAYLWRAVGMTWSLAYEWVFYVLVAVAIACRRRLVAPLLVGAWALADLHYVFAGLNGLIAAFLLGGAVLVLRQRPLLTVLLILGVVATRELTLIGATILLAGFVRLTHIPRFLLPFVVAGKLTYSFYLIHGICLLMAYSLTRQWLTPSHLADVDMYAFAALAAGFSGVLSAVWYRYFEMPYFAAKRGSGAVEASLPKAQTVP